jgi:D-alanyl-D-alanine dipeptidase
VIVEENFQPMVFMGKIKGLLFRDGLPDENKYCREEIAERLIVAAKQLPRDTFFKVIFGFRSIELQLELFNKYFTEIKFNYPELPLEEQERLTRLKVADPRNGKYGPHQTGGALDLTLCNSNGIDLDMGDVFEGFTEKTRTYPLKDGKLLLNEIEFRNRTILYDAMTSAGFQNYPMEWWHYSYGDKMWAAYSGLKSCCYGPINEKIKLLC